MSYASIADLTTFGLPSTAMGVVSDPQKQGALDSATAYMDSKFRGRYPLQDVPPAAQGLVSWGVEVTRCCAVLAAEEVLTIRGWDPNNAGDAAIVQRASEMRTWLDQVQRGAAHPNVEALAAPQGPMGRPQFVSSSSVAVGSSATDTNRGW